MFIEENKNKCYGCSACEAICPKQCIMMIKNNEGFEYPKINYSTCVNCKKCESVCSIRLNNFNGNINQSGYAAYTKNDEDRKNSSSGGIFATIAKVILQENGVVFGAAYDDKFLVHHIKIDDVNKLHLIMGSKYVQSKIDYKIYSEIKQLLNKGIKVLFSGTPCQISGIRSYLNKDYDNLYTIDIICHGVPSKIVWEKYLQNLQMKNKGNIKEVSFRNKYFGWNLYSMKIDFNNGCSYKKIAIKDKYMQLFLNNIILRKSCYDCKYKSRNRCSDLSLGDFWGAYRHIPKLDDDKGLSIILVNNDKGRTLFKKIKNDIISKSVNPIDILPDSFESMRSISIPQNRNKFFNELDNNELDFLFEKYISKDIKVTIKKEIKIILKVIRHFYKKITSKKHYE